MALLAELNPAQQEAVLATEGPVLVLAGAGSGKTRVITYRIAWLIEQGVPPETILAVTFTNKAADEMRERILQLVPRSPAEPWVSTFHALCSRMLRQHAPRLHLRPDFPIYDEDDQLKAVQLALAALDLSERDFPPRTVLAQISHAKNHLRTPEQMEQTARDAWERHLARLFAGYQQGLRRAGALDFDDLLLRALELLDGHPEVRARWQQRFHYLHVDEYQDTNRPQYELLVRLAAVHRNLCVVGDEDQAIYGWRGATVRNILNFTREFPGARVIRLEENYRSTQTILDAAAAVVAHNRNRLGKSLVATRAEGSPLRFYQAEDAAAEAEFVATEIARLAEASAAQRVAVLYRTNAQSRALEEALRQRGLRYRVVGGFSFFRRAEVRDALAYLRLVMHPADDVALLRIINTPPRGIGAGTLQRLRQQAAEQGGSLWDAVVTLSQGTPGSRPNAALAEFRTLIEELRAEFATLPPAEFLRRVLDRSGYLDLLEQQRTPEDRARSENLHELVNALAEATERGGTLEGFLDHVVLMSDADEYDVEAPISLMTLHAAKGLEFDHVFLVGLEEGLFPHARSTESEEGLEEERRLCYVGMTRARQTLTLTCAAYRRGYGSSGWQATVPSRFLREIPIALLETVDGSIAEAGETRRYADPELDEYALLRRARRLERRGAMQGARRAAGSNLIGLRVRHPSYGIGTIIAIEGEGEDRKITVHFLDYGTKKLVERYAQLERA
ncbi:MAG: UvrD-helicase domain-containing protein [Firmicutes bacterium]|nr:UvrD-helicase domain-containing protein [Bacillota bacterium]